MYVDGKMGANLGKVLHQVPVINLQISSVVLLVH